MLNPSQGHDIGAMIAQVQTYHAQGRFDLLIGVIVPLTQLLPHEPALHNVAGAAFAALGRHGEAVRSYDAALSLQPLFADAHANRGVALKALGQIEAAIKSYDRAIGCAPHNPGFHYNRANALRDLNQPDEAIAAYDQAILLQPDHVDALINRGNVAQATGRREEALASYDRALALRPDFADAHVNRGNVLHAMRRMDDAARSYAAAIRIRPDHVDALARAAFLSAHMCDWSARDDAAIVKLGVSTGVVPPFNMLALDQNAARGLARSQGWARAHYPAGQRVAATPAASSRIRIGYVSADFHEHATMHLIAGVLERHDRDRFEIHAFSYGPERDDAMRHRAVQAVDRFHRVGDMSDAAIAALIRAQGIDIAVDLKGYTQDSRPAIFAHGAAPVQVAWLGYPGTSGADFIDYIVADRTVIPKAKRRHYSEKLICLPHSYQPNDDGRPIAEQTPSRAVLGLAEDAFVFCCFNNSFKICPEVFAVWMRLLGKVDGSLLWLLRDNDHVAGNLRRAAERHGIDPGRLVFAERMFNAEHLARHRHADLFLDTLAYNAHTTASDALWAGLPVVTMAGDGFASRVAASLLNAVDLPELITDGIGAYEALALALARQPARLAGFRDRLALSGRDSALFDTALFVRHLEQGYQLAHDRRLKGLRPDHIEIADLRPAQSQAA